MNLFRRTRKKQRRIGEGQYGFVISPAIPCEGKNVSKKVSKVFKTRNTLSPFYQSKYKSFNVRKAKLMPVVQKLQEIDPSQTTYIYPEFCDIPGPLTNEHRSNGVTNNSKYSSYLMILGGHSYKQVFNDYFNILSCAYRAYDEIVFLIMRSTDRNIMQLAHSTSNNLITKTLNYATIRDKRIESVNAIIKPKERPELLFSKMKPLIQRIEKIVDVLHKEGIVHRDLHYGNVLLEWTDTNIDNWLKQVNDVIQSIRDSEQYKQWAVRNNRQDFDGFKLDFDQMMTCLKLIDKMEPLDLSLITPKIIDWDSAHIITTNDDKEYAKKEFENLLEYLLPKNGPFSWFIDRYLSNYGI
jgi:serine/threonine protein kinase